MASLNIPALENTTLYSAKICPTLQNIIWSREKNKHISLEQSQKMVQVPTDIPVNWLQTENNSVHSGDFSRQTEWSLLIVFISYLLESL